MPACHLAAAAAGVVLAMGDQVSMQVMGQHQNAVSLDVAGV